MKNAKKLLIEEVHEKTQRQHRERESRYKFEMNELKRGIEKYSLLYEDTGEEMNELREENEDLRRRKEYLEQLSRVSNVIIRGLKENKDESQERLIESDL